MNDIVEDFEPRGAYSYTLPEKPCVVLHITQEDAFVIGTYELLDFSGAREKLEYQDLSDDDLKMKLKNVNNRFGSLHLYMNTKSPPKYRLCSTLKCSSGGVFESVLLNKEHDADYSSKFLVAHANGMIGQYEVMKGTILPTKQPFRVVEDSSALLTCIDSERDIRNDSLLTLVGDSNGMVTLIVAKGNSSKENDYNPIKIQVCEDPVWQVKFIPGDKYNSQMFIVGAENSCWCIYKFNSESRQLVKIYENNDFQAGVTSLCLRSSLILPFNSSKPFNLFVGSYDATIREYCVDINEGSVQVETRGSLQVPDAGIWRIDYICGRSTVRKQDESGSQFRNLFDTLNIATMYQNPCQISIPIAEDNDCCTSSSLDKGKLLHINTSHVYNNIDKLDNKKEKPLYYGFVQSRKSSATTTFCIIDFNNYLLLFIPKF